MAIATCGNCNNEMIPIDKFNSDLAEWFSCTNCGRVVHWPLSKSQVETSKLVAREV